jgi:predicted ribosomally synthesized peptide with SipW-like signal peptide
MINLITKYITWYKYIMRRALLSLFLLFTVTVLTISATTSYFSDSKEIKGNAFTAGTINIDAEGNTLVPFDFTNIKPGDFRRKWVSFKNTGTLPIGRFIVTKTNVIDEKNLLSNINVSVQCAIDGVGENMAFFTNNWGTKPTVSSWFNNSDILVGPAYYRIAAGKINPLETYTCAIDFTMPLTVGNELQGATASFDLVFLAEQSY